MLHGKGKQRILSSLNEKYRRRFLSNRYNFPDEKAEELEITDESSGGGNTGFWTFKTFTFPFPMNQRIRRKKYVDLRDDKSVGD